MREWRASSFGACATRLIHEQHGDQALDPPATLQAAFTRGREHEEACVAEMRAQGWEVWGEQDAIGIGPDGPLAYGDTIDTSMVPWYLSGHLDGRCQLPAPSSRHRVLEVKAPNAWTKFERAYKTGTYTDPLTHMYAWQTSIYMVATGLECVVACLDEGGTLYPRHLRWFVIETPIHSEAEIIARATLLSDLAEQPACPSECEDGLRDDWSCPYRHLHNAPERPTVVDGELDRLVGLYGAEKALRDVSEARMKEYREQIDLHLGLDDTRETDNSIATRVTTSRRTLDKADLEADMLASGMPPLTQYEKQSTSTSIRVTVKDVAPDPSFDL